MIDHGLVCENAYANGCPTQFSAPSIFTSTLPLDFGGYDRGICHRPVSFVEVLARHGYHCFGTASGPWESRVFGYSRGFDAFYHCYDINSFTQPLLNEIYRDYYKQQVIKKKISRQEGEAQRRSFLLFCLPFIREEIASRIEHTYPDWIYPKQYSRSSLRAYLQVIDTFIDSLKKHEVSTLDVLVPKITAEKTASLIERVVMTLVNKWFPGLVKTKREFFPTVYAAELFSHYNNYFSQHATKRKQFHYMHILDTHELRFSDDVFQLHVPPIGTKKNEQNMLWFERSILHIDKHLDGYLKKLFADAGKDNVTIILSGDHGYHYGYPNRAMLHQQESHLADIYHESLDCALMIHAPHRKPLRYTDHCSLLDVAPTILDLLDLPAERSFKGTSLYLARKSSIIISETAGRGPCHLQTKPIYLSIKQPPYKMIYREFFHDDERIRKNTEVYHLSDRYDQKDLSGDPSLREMEESLLQIAHQRIREIRGL